MGANVLARSEVNKAEASGPEKRAGTVLNGDRPPTRVRGACFPLRAPGLRVVRTRTSCAWAEQQGSSLSSSGVPAARGGRRGNRTLQIAGLT